MPDRQSVYRRPAKLVVPGRDVVIVHAPAPIKDTENVPLAVVPQKKAVDFLSVKRVKREAYSAEENRHDASRVWLTRQEVATTMRRTTVQTNQRPHSSLSSSLQPPTPTSSRAQPFLSTGEAPKHKLWLGWRRNVIIKKLSQSAKMLMSSNTPAPGMTGFKKEKTPKNHLWRRIAYQTVVMVLLAVSLYAAIDTWVLNKEIKQEQQKAVAAAQSDDSSARQEAEGKDETPISALDIKNYKVTADLPRVIRINKINVEARVLQMGVNKDGSMQSPINAYDAGWYTGSVRPGQLGAAAIVGHASGPTREGLFAYLDKLKAGDIVEIERGDGTKLTYSVVKTETVALKNVDMNKFLRPVDGEAEGLNLMTCAGNWVESSKTRDQRVIVYTKRT